MTTPREKDMQRRMFEAVAATLEGLGFSEIRDTIQWPADALSAEVSALRVIAAKQAYFDLIQELYDRGRGEAIPAATRLAVASAALNESGDAVTEQIEQFEDALQRMNVGLESWVSADVTAGGVHYTSLGYTKLNGRWCVAASSHGHHEALIEATIEVQLVMVPLLEALVDALIIACETMTKKIRAAKAALESK